MITFVGGGAITLPYISNTCTCSTSSSAHQLVSAEALHSGGLNISMYQHVFSIYCIAEHVLQSAHYLLQQFC